MNYKNEKAEVFIKEYLDQFENISAGQKNYRDSYVLNGAVMMYKVSKEDSYKSFVLNYLKNYIKEDGTISLYEEEDFDINNLCFGNLLIFADEETGEEKYKKAAEAFISRLCSRPETEQDIFLQKNNLDQVGCDGRYRAQVFHMEYDTKFGGKGQYNDIIAQFKNIKAELSDAVSLDTVRYLMAVIDAMEVMAQPIYEHYRALGELFKQRIKEVLEKENTLEATALAMAAYVLLKACRMKVLLTEKYEERALRIVNNIIDNNFEQIKNDPISVGIFMMAYAEGIN